MRRIVTFVIHSHRLHEYFFTYRPADHVDSQAHCITSFYLPVCNLYLLASAQRFLPFFSKT